MLEGCLQHHSLKHGGTDCFATALGITYWCTRHPLAFLCETLPKSCFDTWLMLWNCHSLVKLRHQNYFLRFRKSKRSSFLASCEASEARQKTHGASHDTLRTLKLLLVVWATQDTTPRLLSESPMFAWATNPPHFLLMQNFLLFTTVCLIQL